MFYDPYSAPGPAVPVVTPVASNTPGTDLLIDPAGSADLYCGPNQDFVLFQHFSGFDYVYGFDPSDTGDVIAIEQNVNGSGLTAVDQLTITDTETGAMISLGDGNTFLLSGVGAGQLDAGDFMIVPEITPMMTVAQPDFGVI